MHPMKGRKCRKCEFCGEYRVRQYYSVYAFCKRCCELPNFGQMAYDWEKKKGLPCSFDEYQIETLGIKIHE